MDYSSLYVSRIRNLCRQRGISINKLAVMSDVKQSTLDNIARSNKKSARDDTTQVGASIQYDAGGISRFSGIE